jgi:hypothetical protein
MIYKFLLRGHVKWYKIEAVKTVSTYGRMSLLFPGKPGCKTGGSGAPAWMHRQAVGAESTAVAAKRVA